MKQSEVYIYLGFLDSGKSTFIYDILSAKHREFGTVLILLCEEGEVEPIPEEYKEDGIFLICIENESELTQERLQGFSDSYDADTVLIEYNGMWKLRRLLEALPSGWRIRRKLLFADSRSIDVYNVNLRELVYDKLAACETVVFNRCTDATDTMALHRLVRGVSGAVEIIYEYSGQYRIRDNIEDTLPYDLDLEVVEISDRAFANWYRGIMEAPSLYDGRTFRFSCRRSEGDENRIGRTVMTCCAEDTSFAGLLVRGAGRLPSSTWMTVEARLSFIPDIWGTQPVAECISAYPCSAPEPETAQII